MIPSIFVSSTIKDLKYLREAVREAITEIAFTPVMSEFGDVGYIYPNSAAKSCYHSLQNCQLFILIIGKEYGSIGEDGLSITHNEFRKSKEHDIPMVTFVDPQVLSYLDVFESDETADIWEKFDKMQNPQRTFQLLKEVSSSSGYNAILPIENTSALKQTLKRQIADFLGSKLFQEISNNRSDIKELIVEVKTLRNQLQESKEISGKEKSDSRDFLITMRFLLEDQNADFKKIHPRTIR